MQPGQLALFRRASAATYVDRTGVLRTAPADALRYAWGGGRNLYFPEEVSLVATPGTYGVGSYIKGGGSNPQNLLPGQTITLSADVWQDAASANDGAGRTAVLFIWSANAAGEWTAQANAGHAGTTPVRLSATFTLPASMADMDAIGIGVYHIGGSGSYLGSVHAERIMVNRGATADDYEPFLQRLLVEPEARNLVVAPSDLTAWIDNGGLAVNADAMVAPDGFMTADTTTVGHTRYVTISGLAEGFYAVSQYVKPANPGATTFLYTDGFFGVSSCTFTPETLAAFNVAGTAVSGRIESVGNGWYRMQMALYVSGGVLNFHTYPTNDDLHGWWHAQVEPGLVATSPITNSRAADVAVLWQQSVSTDAGNAAQPADAALRWDAASGQFDLVIDEQAGDLKAEDTLLTAVVLSLMCDAQADADDVPAGSDRRGWWADAYSEPAESYGSRLWLLAREKQLPATIARARSYVLQALQWLIDDGLANAVDATVFAPRLGWLTAQVDVTLDGASRRYRFVWSDQAQVWTLQGDA